jgi:hypothetical protein
MQEKIYEEFQRLVSESSFASRVRSRAIDKAIDDPTGENTEEMLAAEKWEQHLLAELRAVNMRMQAAMGGGS